MSALQDGKSSKDWLHSEVKVFNTSEWLRWYILCYVYFTTIKIRKKIGIVQVHNLLSMILKSPKLWTPKILITVRGLPIPLRC